MKRGYFLMTLVLIGAWILNNWFRIVVIIFLIMIYSKLAGIETDLYGGNDYSGNDKVGISANMTKGFNFILDDLDSIKASVQHN